MTQSGEPGYKSKEEFISPTGFFAEAQSETFAQSRARTAREEAEAEEAARLAAEAEEAEE